MSFVLTAATLPTDNYNFTVTQVQVWLERSATPDYAFYNGEETYGEDSIHTTQLDRDTAADVGIDMRNYAMIEESAYKLNELLQTINSGIRISLMADVHTGSGDPVGEVEFSVTAQEVHGAPQVTETHMEVLAGAKDDVESEVQLLWEDFVYSVKDALEL